MKFLSSLSYYLSMPISNILSRKVFILLGQFIVLIFALSYFVYHYLVNVFPDQKAKTAFAETSCFLLDKKLSTKEGLLPSYRAGFFVSYFADGVQYHRWAFGNGLDTSFFHDKKQQENLLLRYQVGGTYACTYYPDNPERIILIKRHEWFAILLLPPAMISFVVLYFFLKNLLRFLQTVTMQNHRYANKNEKI